MGIMKVIKRLDDELARLEKGAIIICFSMLVAVIVFNILSRHVRYLPSHQFFEAGPHLVLWLSLMGASLALKQQRHIRLELILRYCSDRLRRWAAVVVNLFGMLIMAILFLSALVFVQNEIAMFDRWGLLSLLFPFFFGVATFRYLVGLLTTMSPEPTADATASHLSEP
jgi:TRAP-type C4-dicarboxylate transport system permease small subunit